MSRRTFRKPQFTLRATLVLLTVLCVLCALCARWLLPHQRQAAGRKLAARLGAETRAIPSAPAWTKTLLTDDLFERIVAIDFANCRTGTEVSGAPELTVADLRALAQMPYLEEINLSGCRMPPDALCLLGQLTRVRSFTMYNSPAADDTLLVAASNWKNLEALQLGADLIDAMQHARPGPSTLRVTPSGLAKLIKLPHLRELRLAGAAIDDDAAAVLRQLPQLNYLDVSYTDLGDAGADMLAALQKLRTLSVAGTELTDRGAKSLAKIRTLERLDCGETSVGDGAVRALAMLPRLQALNLSSTNVSDAATPCLAAMPTLVELHLDRTAVTDTGVASLCSSVSLREISVRYTKTGDNGIRSLASIRTLQKVQAEGVNASDETWCEFAKRRPEINLKRMGLDMFSF